ncbi:DUF7260 family protein [Salinigranum marinum]|uniref:DUF7260 family protein n=1 Tax=Salinigranum marinum TaxID=1515595 RepID=UPI003CCE2C51
MTLAAARRAVDRERRVCVAEREAFRSFRTAVARLDGGSDAPVEPSTARGGRAAVTTARTLGVPAGQPADASDGCRSVRDAYRRSVLAADHVGDDETLTEHVAAELGADLARRVQTGPMTPDLRQALVDRTGVAIRARESFVELLGREADSVDAVDGTCRRLRSRIDRARSWERAAAGVPLDAAFEAWSELDRIETHLDEVATDRQATLARHRRSFAVVDDDVTSYLYGCRPGLATIASLGQRVTDGRRAIADGVGRAE